MKSDMKEEEEEAAPNSPLAEKTGLRQALVLVSSLMASCQSMLCFPAKWQLIQDKLEQLSSGLKAVDVRSNSSENSELTRLLEAIISAANETQSLAHRCGDGSFIGGKLLMKSDLDVVASRFELHIKQLTEIRASRILTHSRAIVVLRPGIGASFEEMRFYVKELFSRVRIGDSEMRAHALATLNEVLHEDEKYVRIVVLEIDDSVSLLASFLELDDMVIVEKAVEALLVITEFESYKGVLIAAGVIAPMVGVLEMGSALAKEKAARALRKLTMNSDNAWSVSSHGGITALLDICGNDHSSIELSSSACGLLRNLSSVGEIKMFMTEEGVVSVLLKLLRSKEEVSQIQAIELLLTMAFEDDAIKLEMDREGVVESLLEILDPSSSHSLKAREVALRAIELFCFPSGNSIHVLIKSGLIDWVLFYLKNDEIFVQELALKAASCLFGISEESKKAMSDAGFMTELVKLLEGKSFEAHEMAAEVLCSMVSIQRNRRRFIQEEHNVNRILQLLDSEETSEKNKFLLSMLMLLADSNSGRRKIAASEYVKILEKLAESDVMDAKNILKKISGNRFWSALTNLCCLSVLYQL